MNDVRSVALLVWRRAGGSTLYQFRGDESDISAAKVVTSDRQSREVVITDRQPAGASRPGAWHRRRAGLQRRLKLTALLVVMSWG